MKSISLLEKKSNDTELPSIYCDLDQVLVAFMKGANAAVGGSFVQIDKDERWKNNW